MGYVYLVVLLYLIPLLICILFAKKGLKYKNEKQLIVDFGFTPVMNIFVVCGIIFYLIIKTPYERLLNYVNK